MKICNLEEKRYEFNIKIILKFPKSYIEQKNLFLYAEFN